MNNPFTQLIDDIDQYGLANYMEEPDYEARFGERVRAWGAQELIVYLFRTYQDSRLGSLLHHLRFAWRDFGYDRWLQILAEVASDRTRLYQLLMFMCDTLAIDIRRLPSSHPNLRWELESSAFRDGVPAPPSKTARAALEDTFDYETLWNRLASEGAPMLKLPPGW
jgi:hypothetical protein